MRVSVRSWPGVHPLRSGYANGCSARPRDAGAPNEEELSTGAVSLFSHISGDAFDSWGWRVPFLLSLLLVGVGLWVRLSVIESPLFAREVEDETVARQPIVEVIKRNPREIILSALLRMSEQAPFYIFTAFVLAYGTETLGFSKGFMTNSVMLAAAISLFSVPFFGHLSDRIGRRRTYLIGAGATLVWGVPYFLLLDSKVGALVVVAIVVSLIPHDMQYGPQAALIAESFTTRLRYSGAGLGYQLASVVAGGPAPLLAVWLLHTFDSSLPIGIYIMGCAVVTISP